MIAGRAARRRGSVLASFRSPETDRTSSISDKTRCRSGAGTRRGTTPQRHEDGRDDTDPASRRRHLVRRGDLRSTSAGSRSRPGATIRRRGRSASPRLACATGGCADIATATPNASANAPARSMYLAAPNAFISCPSRKFTEFAPPSQGRDARRRKTRVVHYLFSGAAGQPGRAMSATVCSYAMRKRVGRHKIREWPLNGAQSRAGSRWAFWSRR